MRGRAQSLRSHMASQHDRGGDPKRWEARFYPAEGLYRCPVPNRPQGQAGAGCKTPFNLRYHFAFRYQNDTVTVRGDCPPKCASCGM